jgi:diacylglycerol kinase family enzyme
MFDYVFGRQEQNEELTIFKSARLEIRAERRRHAMVMIDGEILRLPFPLVLAILPEHLNVLGAEEILEKAP